METSEISNEEQKFPQLRDHKQSIMDWIQKNCSSEHIGYKNTRPMLPIPLILDDINLKLVAAIPPHKSIADVGAYTLHRLFEFQKLEEIFETLIDDGFILIQSGLGEHMITILLQVKKL